MKFLTMYTPDSRTPGAPPSKEHMARMEQFIDESRKAGVLLATGGLLPASQGGAVVRSSGGKITVTDGPYSEAKEVIAGFALLQVNSKDEALESVRSFLEVAGDGESELRQIMEPGGDCAAR